MSLRRSLAALTLLVGWGPVQAAPNLLFNSCHAAASGMLLAALGGGVVNTTVFVDATQPSGCTPIFDGNFFFDQINDVNTKYRVPDNTPESHAPYLVQNISWSGYNNELDTSAYPSNVAHSVTQVWAYVPGALIPGNTPPPVGIDNVSPSESGGSIEFGYPVSPPTGCPSSPNPSDATACLSQVFVAIAYAHPSWVPWDIRGALRQTATNWPTWSPGNGVGNPYGFGRFDYAAAVAVAGTNAIYLQPPNVSINLYNGYATFTMYPFRQTRRTHEEVYSVSASYSWPAKNEYTTADLTAASATLVCTGNGEVEPTCSYSPLVGGTYTFVALTTDGSGNYSAVQSFMPQTVMISGPQIACH